MSSSTAPLSPNRIPGSRSRLYLFVVLTIAVLTTAILRPSEPSAGAAVQADARVVEADDATEEATGNDSVPREEVLQDDARLADIESFAPEPDEAPVEGRTAGMPQTLGELFPTDGTAVGDLGADVSDPATTITAVGNDATVGDDATVGNDANGCDLPEELSSVDDAEDQPERWYTDTFDALDPAWQVLAGTWGVEGGQLVQSDSNGYDLIAELAVAPPAPARVAVDLEAVDGTLGGGLMVAQPLPMTRAGAFVVDFTDGGRFLRWGAYDLDTGRYGYIGGVAMPDHFDPSVRHRLSIDLTSTATRVLVDDHLVGQFSALGQGRVGLVTSLSAVAFDNFSIDELSNVAG